MTPLESLLERFPNAKKTVNGWSAHCPAHEDRKASLSISAGEDGKALVHCHAGCNISAILAAVGAELPDLFPGKAGATPTRNAKPPTDGQTFASANDAVTALERVHGKRSALWTYHEAQGQPVGVLVRWDKPDGKVIRPASRHGDRWCFRAMHTPHPLYQLPALAAASRVVVCEGEKAADGAQSLGFVATTSAGGSNAADKTDWQPLAGKEVWILPDNDKPGQKYCETVAGILSKLAPAPTIRVVELPELPEKGDIVDWIEAHGDAAEPSAMQAEIETLACATPAWVLQTDSPATGPVLICLANVEPRPVSWLWPERIPRGRITLLVGRPGEGKSYLTIDAAARVSTGAPWPDGAPCPRGSVLLMTGEDDPSDTIRPRLDAHGADVRQIHLLSAVRRSGNKGPSERLITLADVGEIAQALDRINDCRLVVIDPVGHFLGGKVDSHKDNEVRAILGPIAMLAERFGAAILVVAHRRKSAGSNADDSALGSRAFSGIARAAWHLSRDPENKDRRLLLGGKNNLAKEGSGLAFSINGTPPRVEWESEPVQMTADEALSTEGQSHSQQTGPEPLVLEKAVSWLKSELISGPRLAADLVEDWTTKQRGAKRTLDRAKSELGVKSDRPTVPGPWFWRLPIHPEVCNLGDLGSLTEIPLNSRNFSENGSKVAKPRTPGNVTPCSAVLKESTSAQPFVATPQIGPYSEKF